MPTIADSRSARRVAGTARAASEAGDRDHRQHEGQHPVAELDSPVDAEGAVRRRTSRRCSSARSGSRDRNRSAGRRHRSPRCRCWRRGWPPPAGRSQRASRGRGDHCHSHLKNRAGQDRADHGPAPRGRGQAGGASRPRCSASRSASPRAPEGRSAGRRRSRRTTIAAGHRAAGQQQQVDQVGGGEGGLGSKGAGQQQPERGERHGTRARHRRRRSGRRRGTRAPAEGEPDAADHDRLEDSTTSSAPTFPASSPDRGSGEAPSRLSSP